MYQADEKIIPVYSGKPEDFCCVGFGSGSGTNLRECAKVIKLSLIVSNRPNAKLLSLDELKDVPKLVIDSKKERWSPYEHRFGGRYLDYDDMLCKSLHRFEEQQGKMIDLIILGGYNKFVREPLLSDYKDRIINVHPADLTKLQRDEHTEIVLGRLYVGNSAVLDALKDHELTTRSTVHLVDRWADNGEILTMGPEVKVDYDSIGNDMVRLPELAKAQQEKQKKASDWPAFITALRMITEGRFAIGTEYTHHNKWRTVYLDGKPLGYGGYEVR